MDRFTPILDMINEKVIFPFRDVPANGWAVVPKKGPLQIGFYFPESRELYDSALMIGGIGFAIFYAYFYERHTGPCIVYALSQLGWCSPGQPMYMWQPLISYYPQTITLEESQRIYDSRGWLPWLDEHDRQMFDNPLRCKWVRLGFGRNEDRLVTHEPAPDNVVFFPVPLAFDRAAWLKRRNRKRDEMERAYEAAINGK